GALLVFGQFDRDEIGTGALWEKINDHWALWILWIVGAAIGIGSQLTMRAGVELPEERWVRIEPSAAATPSA
ncbi:MAG: hypothetical protein ACRDHN_08800, partial [Thermomicrobiales bacterium]